MHPDPGWGWAPWWSLGGLPWAPACRGERHCVSVVYCDSVTDVKMGYLVVLTCYPRGSGGMPPGQVFGFRMFHG